MRKVKVRRSAAMIVSIILTVLGTAEAAPLVLSTGGGAARHFDRGTIEDTKNLDAYARFAYAPDSPIFLAFGKRLGLGLGADVEAGASHDGLNPLYTAAIGGRIWFGDPETWTTRCAWFGLRVGQLWGHGEQRSEFVPIGPARISRTQQFPDRAEYVDVSLGGFRSLTRSGLGVEFEWSALLADQEFGGRFRLGLSLRF